MKEKIKWLLAAAMVCSMILVCLPMESWAAETDSASNDTSTEAAVQEIALQADETGMLACAIPMDGTSLLSSSIEVFETDEEGAQYVREQMKRKAASIEIAIPNNNRIDTATVVI